LAGDEAGKRLAHMDVIGEKNAAGFHHLPGGLEFEGHISGGVQAVMQENVGGPWAFSFAAVPPIARGLSESDLNTL
jgi:hypothetical protein